MARAQHPHGHRLRLGRYSETGRVYIVTTVVHGRHPIFADWYAACACARSLHAAPADTSVTSLAWVVMPDHVHWLFSLNEGSLERVMQRFKSRAARAVNASMGAEGVVWQRGYHDHAVRREEDLRALARYVIGNPVRAGLARSVGAYPFWDAAWL